MLEVMQLVAPAAGYQGMVGGQMLDLLAEGRQITLKELETVHRLKTGALLTAAVRAGALVGGGSRAEVTALTDYGEKFGLAFQITDDLLDVEGDAAEMGKAAGHATKSGRKPRIRRCWVWRPPGSGPGAWWRRPWPSWNPFRNGPNPCGNWPAISWCAAPNRAMGYLGRIKL